MGREFSHRLNTDETQILKKKFQICHRDAEAQRMEMNFFTSVSLCLCGQSSVCEIEIRTTHEIMAARTTQLALLVDQLMPALQTKSPMLAGNIFVR
jgi:hypothetical protein